MFGRAAGIDVIEKNKEMKLKTLPKNAEEFTATRLKKLEQDHEGEKASSVGNEIRKVMQNTTYSMAPYASHTIYFTESMVH